MIFWKFLLKTGDLYSVQFEFELNKNTTDFEQSGSVGSTGNKSSPYSSSDCLILVDRGCLVQSESWGEVHFHEWGVDRAEHFVGGEVATLGVWVRLLLL